MEKVNHPEHYAGNGCPCECIEVIHYVTKDVEPITAFSIGNAIKYLWRLGKKEPDENMGQTMDEKILEDLKKASWYLDDAIEMMTLKIESKSLR